MRSAFGKIPAAVGAAALLALAVCGPVTAADESGESGDETIELTGAEFRWGMMNEANNAAHAPGTWNFFSAGKIPDPGKGNTAMKREDWDQSSGSVEIQKWDGSAYKDATWDGLSTDSDGEKITSAGSGRYSNHQFVFSGGKGTAAKDGSAAHIEWEGAVSVVFYSGYTFFYLSDPVLDVADGNGKITATLSGFGGDREDPDAWEPIEPREVTIADLPGLTLTDSDGFTATPAYDDVKVSTASCPNTGSFPKSFIDFQEDLGTAAFWCKSGSSTDTAKKALPVAVSFDASRPITPPTPGPPTPTPTATPTTPTPTASPKPGANGGKTTLTGAALAWGMANEANNAAHAPGTWNFFTAGKVRLDGGTELDADDWKQSAGNVAIQKWDGEAFKKATWNGRSTDADGTSIAPPSSKVYSGHQFVFSKGTGSADLSKRTVHIKWTGDVTVLFYSGLTFFTLSDPELTVANGKGTLTASVSGVGGSRDDPTSGGDSVSARRVTVADLPAVSFSDGKGLKATPAFDSVDVNTTSCKESGSFPKSFIEVQEDLGTAGFWCRTGSSTDDAKEPLALAVSFDASDPVDAAEPDDSDSDSDDVSNDAPGLADALNSVPTAVADAGRTLVDAISAPLRLVSSHLDIGHTTLWIVGTVLWALAAIALAVALLRFPTPEPSPHD